MKVWRLVTEVWGLVTEVCLVYKLINICVDWFDWQVTVDTSDLPDP